MAAVDEQIEQQLTLLLRRVQPIHLSTGGGDVNLERSAYGIMCKLADEGPQRLGALATSFRLDPSTITRQVQSLVGLGLAEREVDPTDRRASILDLSDTGRAVLEQTRNRRRDRLREAIAHWPDDDRKAFGRLLEKFNTSVDDLISDRSDVTGEGAPAT
jgi:DNA-binding MarR family transcriptional regulator